MSSTSEPKIDVDALMALMPVLDERGQRRILAMVERVNQSRREKSTTSTGKALIRPRPTTDDELHEYIREECGYDIPRVAVCNGHQSPFSFVADAFFERYDALFQVGSRELGKTLGVSVVNYVNAETRPGCTSCTFGAIESQAQRAYDHVTSFVYVRDRDGTKRLKSQMAGVPLRKKTEWKTGSKIEIIVGSESGVNSPHPHKVHADEVDLMAQRVWNQAQPLDALVATPTGWSQMGDLSVGDLVIGSDGRSHIVLAVHEHGEKDVYRVDLTDGRSTECCGDHLWQVSTKSGSNRVWSVQKTEHLLHKLTGRRADGYPRYRYRLPMPAPVSYDGGRERRLPLDPYVLGVLLGDGCLRRRLVNFRALDNEIVELVDARLPAGVGIHTGVYADSAANHRITRGSAGCDGTPNPVVEIMEELGLEGCDSHTKFIPQIYMHALITHRIELLRGLMDTDGSFTKDPYFASVSEQLAYGVRDLVLSLGGRSTIRRKKTSQSSFDNCGYIYEVSVHLPYSINPFKTSAKAAKFVPRKQNLNPAIRAITPIGKKVVRCITVSAEDGLYLTDDFIVTHNSRNMSSGGSVFGERIKAQDFATSSLKSNHGLVASIIKECDEAIENGFDPPWQIYYSCVYEASEEVSECQCAPEAERRARLTELGRDPNELCACDRVVKGEWSEDNPRTLSTVCKGKFFRSRGWMAHSDVKRKFRQNTRGTWEAEMECRRVSVDGVYLEGWVRERFSFRGWTPRPEYGNCYTGTDWGGGAESTILWVQGPLRTAVRISDTVVIPEGAYVVFDEFLKAGIGATKLADEVLAREAAWRHRIPGFRITARFADVAGRQQRDDWREHNPPLKTVWWLQSRDFDPQVTCLQDLVEDKLYWVDIGRCSRHVDDIEAWRQQNGREVHDESSHTMASARYLMTNVVTRNQRRRNKSSKSELAEPVAIQRGETVSSAVGSTHSSDSLSAERRWREQMGQTFPSSMRGPGPWR